MRYMEIFVLFLIFSGETLAICSEVWSAKLYQSRNFLRYFIPMVLLFAVAGSSLIAGYMLGYALFGNIWMLSAVSITSILIVEPLVSFLLFRQLPSLGSLIGLVLGALGLIATLTI